MLFGGSWHVWAQWRQHYSLIINTLGENKHDIVLICSFSHVSYRSRLHSCFCGVFTLQYKIPRGNCCCNLAYKFDWTELTIHPTITCLFSDDHSQTSQVFNLSTPFYKACLISDYSLHYIFTISNVSPCIIYWYPNKPTSQLFNCIATDDKKELHGQEDWQTKKVDTIPCNWDVAKMVKQYKINISELQVYENRDLNWNEFRKCEGRIQLHSSCWEV